MTEEKKTATAARKAASGFLANWHNKFLAKQDELKAKYGPQFDQPVQHFSLNRAEQAVVNEWLESLHPEILAIQQKQRAGSGDNYAFVGKDEAYYGAVGGGVTYSFIPTSLGLIITVKESTTGKELNVSDALEWHFYG